jgi:hypothetical protein
MYVFVFVELLRCLLPQSREDHLGNKARRGGYAEELTIYGGFVCATVQQLLFIFLCHCIMAESIFDSLKLERKESDSTFDSQTLHSEEISTVLELQMS